METLIIDSILSTRAKNALIDYYYTYCNNEKNENEISFQDLALIILGNVQILRNVGLRTLKEIEEFLQLNQINYQPCIEAIDLKEKRKLLRGLDDLSKNIDYKNLISKQ